MSKCLIFQANAQEKFLRIKHAYNTLLNSCDSDSKRRYNTGSRASGFSYSTEDSSTLDEEFYGLGKSNNKLWSLLCALYSIPFRA